MDRVARPAKDIIILLAAQTGEEAATRELFSLYWNRTLRRVRSMLSTDDRDLDGEDLTQEVFARALTAPFDREKAAGSIWPWLATIAGSIVHDHYRRLQRDRTTLRQSQYLQSMKGMRTATDMDRVRVALLCCLGDLDPDIRIAFVLSYVDELSPGVVGGIFGWSKAKTSTCLSRARDTLAKCMAKSGLNYGSFGSWNKMTTSNA